MASVRLTNDMRRNVIIGLLRHRFSKEENNIEKRRESLANSVYNDVYNDDDRAAMAKLPHGWLGTSNSMRVQFGRDGSRFTWLSFKDDTERRFKNEDLHGCLVTYSNEHLFSVTFAKLQDDESELKATKEDLKQKLRGTLNSVTTVKKLLEIWPEVAPFAQKYLAVTYTNLPAVQFSHLNKALNLSAAA